MSVWGRSFFRQSCHGGDIPKFITKKKMAI